MGLFDALMIKDNHVDFCGGMKKTLQKTEKYISSLSKQFDVVGCETTPKSESGDKLIIHTGT